MSGHEVVGWDDRRVMLVVAGLVGEAWSVIEPNLAGLTDAEYFWEPMPGCWGVRRRGDIRSSGCWGRGEWAVETSLDGSTAPSTTTIGWRLMHAYDCTNDFTSRAFGEGGRDWNTIEVPGTASGAVELMTDAVRGLQNRLASATDDVLVAAVDDDFHKPRWLLLDKALLEAIHHCAEVGVLRSVFHATHNA